MSLSLDALERRSPPMLTWLIAQYEPRLCDPALRKYVGPPRSHPNPNPNPHPNPKIPTPSLTLTHTLTLPYTGTWPSCSAV